MFFENIANFVQEVVSSSASGANNIQNRMQQDNAQTHVYQYGNNINVDEINTNNNASNTHFRPASKKALQNLSIVSVTADDLLEETNKECLICLEEQCIGIISA